MVNVIKVVMEDNKIVHYNDEVCYVSHSVSFAMNMFALYKCFITFDTNFA